ncbi:hypothetical protein SLINC_5212 [Streptomyces lincolnensis]|uniref:Uncharacterized protein n=2 Tax=Streptomyces lincolnensis TaxID=1915 RepID=A0A1B1MFP1_STRLN|nr:hypothetical protein SLINC_5212 [Streptomyces lincolnensis]AXG56307.1 hypothetical protein SLCG_5152 [Streptomyces lincolnensis]
MRVRLATLVPVAMAMAAVFGTPAAEAAPQGPEPDLPDMAVVVAGGTGRTTTVRSGEEAFDRLWQVLRPTFTGTERVPEAWSEGRFPTVRITVLWGLTGVGGWPQTNSAPGGDVAMWRQDQLVVDGSGTPWVRSDMAPEVRDDDIRWHRAPRSALDRMDRAGLLDGSGGRDAGAGDGSSEGWSADGAWWAVPGLAVGFVAGVGGTLLIRRAAARPGAGPPREEPRQELIDL